MIVLARGAGVLVRPVGLGWVYFVENRETGRIKIGHSHDPADRIAHLGTGNDCELALLGAVEGSLRSERDMHKRFAADRVRGEWFDARIKPAVLSLIVNSTIDLDTALRTERQGEEAEARKRAAIARHKQMRSKATTQPPHRSMEERTEDLASAFAEVFADILRPKPLIGPRTGLERAVEVVRRHEREQAQRKAECGETWAETQARLSRETNA